VWQSALFWVASDTRDFISKRVSSTACGWFFLTQSRHKEARRSKHALPTLDPITVNDLEVEREMPFQLPLSIERAA